MNEHNATEQAYKNGYKNGYKKGVTNAMIGFASTLKEEFICDEKIPNSLRFYLMDRVDYLLQEMVGDAE